MRSFAIDEPGSSVRALYATLDQGDHCMMIMMIVMIRVIRMIVLIMRSMVGGLVKIIAQR